MFWKIFFSFFRRVRQISVFIIFVIVTLLAYLHFHGLPEGWKRSLLQELTKHGVYLEIDSLHIDPLKGIVARGVQFTPHPESEIILKAKELALGLKLWDVSRKHFSLHHLEVDGSDIQVCSKKGKSLVNIQHLAGNFRFKNNSVVFLESVTGDLPGLRLEVSGRLDLNQEQAKSGKPAQKLNLEAIQSSLAKIKIIETKTPSVIQIWVDGKVAEPNTLYIKAKIDTQTIVYDGWRIDSIATEATYADGVVKVPSLVVKAGVGKWVGNVEYKVSGRKAVFDFNSTLDISKVMKLMYPSEKNWFRTVRYTKPPSLKLSGQWLVQDPNGLEAQGSLDWQDWYSNEVFIRSTQAEVKIVGRKFQFSNLRLARSEGEVRGNFSMDFGSQSTTLDLTTSIAFLELTRLIGPKTEELFQPYQFLTPPKIRLKGTIGLEDDAFNDLFAHVECEHFKIWRLSAANVAADVRRYRKSLEIAKYASGFYDGHLEGDAVFDFTTPAQDWAFHCHFENVDFDRFTHDLWEYQEVKGKMTGWAEMSGIMKNSKPLRGRGEIKIADGILWRIPLFGAVFLKWIPIIGEQKATKAYATFTVADEKAHVDDMKISAGIMTITMKGDYKFDQSLDFIMQGHFLRDIGIGIVFDPFTKAFEYHLGGKLADSHWDWEPRFIPKDLLLQFGNGNSHKKEASESQ